MPLSRVAVGIATASVLAWAGCALLLDLTGHSPLPRDVDAIIVAGCSVDEGGVPSDCLAARTDRGVALYQAHVAPVLLFTGGVGDHAPSEAEVAAARAAAQGVPQEAILLETQSTSTEENALYAATLGEFQHIVVVSDAWHTHRIRHVFGRYFDTVDTVGVDSPLHYRIWGASREVLAISWYIVGKGYWRDLL